MSTIGRPGPSSVMLAVLSDVRTVRQRDPARLSSLCVVTTARSIPAVPWRHAASGKPLGAAQVRAPDGVALRPAGKAHAEETCRNESTQHNRRADRQRDVPGVERRLPFFAASLRVRRHEKGEPYRCRSHRERDPEKRACGRRPGIVSEYEQPQRTSGRSEQYGGGDDRRQQRGHCKQEDIQVPALHDRPILAPGRRRSRNQPGQVSMPPRKLEPVFRQSNT